MIYDSIRLEVCGNVSMVWNLGEARKHPSVFFCELSALETQSMMLEVGLRGVVMT